MMGTRSKISLPLCEGSSETSLPIVLWDMAQRAQPGSLRLGTQCKHVTMRHLDQCRNDLPTDMQRPHSDNGILVGLKDRASGICRRSEEGLCNEELELKLVLQK